MTFVVLILIAGGVVGLVLVVLMVYALVVAAHHNDLDANYRASIHAGHNADDPECIYWAGDRRGADLTATCPECSTAPKERPWWLK